MWFLSYSRCQFHCLDLPESKTTTRLLIYIYIVGCEKARLLLRALHAEVSTPESYALIFEVLIWLSTSKSKHQTNENMFSWSKTTWTSPNLQRLQLRRRLHPRDWWKIWNWMVQERWSVWHQLNSVGWSYWFALGTNLQQFALMELVLLQRKQGCKNGAGTGVLQLLFGRVKIPTIHVSVWLRAIQVGYQSVLWNFHLPHFCRIHTRIALPTCFSASHWQMVIWPPTSYHTFAHEMLTVFATFSLQL